MDAGKDASVSHINFARPRTRLSRTCVSLFLQIRMHLRLSGYLLFRICAPFFLSRMFTPTPLRTAGPRPEASAVSAPWMSCSACQHHDSSQVKPRQLRNSWVGWGSRESIGDVKVSKESQFSGGSLPLSIPKPSVPTSSLRWLALPTTNTASPRASWTPPKHAIGCSRLWPCTADLQ